MSKVFSDTELLARLRQSDKAAFEQLYRQQYYPIFSYAARFLPDLQAAEDVTTESFLKLWERLPRIENLGALYSFLLVTTKNGCLNVLRSKHRESNRYKELYRDLESDSQPAMDQAALRARLFEHIHKEIQQLSPQLRQVFTMSFIEGLSNEEIAQKLGIENQSVRNDKSRALKQLRIALAGREELLLLLFCFLLQSPVLAD